MKRKWDLFKAEEHNGKDELWGRSPLCFLGHSPETQLWSSTTGYFHWAPWVHRGSCSESTWQMGGRWEGVQSCRDTQNWGHSCFCVYSGPRMDDVTSSSRGEAESWIIHEPAAQPSEIINRMSALPHRLQNWCGGAALPRLRGHGHQCWAHPGGRRHSQFFPW